MLQLYKQAITNQYEATLQTLRDSLAACGPEHWNARVCNFSIPHVAYHTLFFLDLYLSGSEEEFRGQPFHLQNKEFFNNYDELSFDSSETNHTRQAMDRYLHFCRSRVPDVMAAETAQSLARPAHTPWLDIPRAELHIYNIRHLQHHSAQISLRLRLDWQTNIRWVKTGWQVSND